MTKSNKRQPSRSLLTFLALIVIAVSILGITAWSILATEHNVNQSINTLSSFYLEEMAGKRVQVFRDAVDRNIGQLERMVKLMKPEDLSSQDSIRKILSDVQILYGANKLALVDEDNIVYTANSTFSDASRYSFLLDDFTEPAIITSNLYGAKKQVVLAIPVNGLTFNGKRIVASFMQLDMDSVVSSLAYEDEASEGNTFIDLYFKNGEDLTSADLGYISAGVNILDYIRKTDLIGDQSFEAVSESFTNGEKGLVTFKNQGQTEYIYYLPVDGTDWMLTVLIRENTIAEQLRDSNATMLRRNISQIIITGVLICAVLLFTGNLNKRNRDMLTRQHELEQEAEHQATLKKYNRELEVKQEELQERLDEIASLNDRLKESSRQATAANAAKTAFLFNMSHDIRTPMNAIIGYTELLERHLGDREKCEDYLEKIKGSNNFLLDLINNVLELARIESGRMQLDETPCSTDTVPETVGSVYDELMKSKNIEFTRTADIKTPFIFIDRVKIDEIILNLVSNAYKYTPSGGRVAFSVNELPCEKEGWTTLQTVVSDTGIGMSEEYLPTIFEEFSREKNATEAKIQGTGLGMPLVKKLVELMGGTVTVESELGRGTTVVVTIPHRIAEAPEALAEKEKSLEADALKGKRILLAEDNDLNAEIATEILSDIGLFVERAEDGIIAVDMLAKAAPHYYDLILMDIQMPNMNGYKATETIRQMAEPEKANIPIFAMTANAFEEDKQDAFEAGMNGHLAKPIEIPALIEMLTSVLK